MKRKYHASAFLFLLMAVVAVAQQRPELNGNPGTIPSGTVLNVRVIDTLSSETSQTGDVFHGTLQDDIEANGKLIFPRGSDVTGRVTSVTPSGRLSTSGVLELSLTAINANNVGAQIVTEPLKVQGESHTKSNTTKIGAGAAAGAIIGAIAGGGKGAAIGTVVGGAAGTGAAAATGKREAKVEPESLLSWTTSVNVLASKIKPGTKVNGEGAVQGEPRLKVRTPSGDTVVPDEATTPIPLGTPGETASPAPAAASGTPKTIASGSTPVPPADASPATAAAPAVPATSPQLGFSARDRRVLRTCLTGDTGDLPSGLAGNQSLPPGSEQQIHKNGILSADLAKRAQALPLSCESQLPKIPSDIERVILNRQVLLLDSQSRVLDLFSLQD
jgi:hypothetical protein